MQFNVEEFGLSTSTAVRVFVTSLWGAHFPLTRMPSWAEDVDGYPASLREQGMGQVAVMIDCTCSVDLKPGDCEMVVDGGRALQPCRYRLFTHMSCIILYPYST